MEVKSVNKSSASKLREPVILIQNTLDLKTYITSQGAFTKIGSGIKKQTTLTSQTSYSLKRTTETTSKGVKAVSA